jgi:SSS family solute:Na+ symporter
LLGIVFAALVAAIVASTASKINSIATIFTLDLYAKYRGVRTEAEDDAGKAGEERHLVFVGRVAACVAILIAIVIARPLLGNFEQAFQFIQEFSGFFTPGITVIFLLGLFWKRANEAGAIAAAIASLAVSLTFWEFVPGVPFMDRMGIVFLISLALAIVVSLLTPSRATADTIDTKVDYATSTGFNAGALAVVVILIALYATWW